MLCKNYQKSRAYVRYRFNCNIEIFDTHLKQNKCQRFFPYMEIGLGRIIHRNIKNSVKFKIKVVSTLSITFIIICHKKIFVSYIQTISINILITIRQSSMIITPLNRNNRI